MQIEIGHHAYDASILVDGFGRLSIVMPRGDPGDGHGPFAAAVGPALNADNGARAARAEAVRLDPKRYGKMVLPEVAPPPREVKRP